MASAIFFNIHNPTYFRKTAYRFVLPVLLFTNFICGQVYNYDPVRHNNFETNPAYLASAKSGNSINLVEQAALFSSDKFYSSTLRLTAYSEKYFSGFGLVLSSTHVNDSTHYSYAGLGAAYRTILLNKIYVKIGALYKVINMKAAPGNFTYYSFVPDTTEIPGVRQKLAHNANISLSFSSPEDKYFASIAILNYALPWGSQTGGSLFPTYYVLNAGNIAKIFDSEKWDIFYTAYAKKYYGQKMYPLSHYLTVTRSLAITRSSSLRVGMRIGAADSQYLQCNPIFSFYKQYSRTKNLTVGMLLDLGSRIKTGMPAFPSATQFNLTYKF